MNEKEQIWKQIIGDAFELEAFEPGLAGLKDQLEDLARGQEISNAWLTKSEKYLSADTIGTTASRLNHLASLHFEAREFADSKRLVLAALIFNQIALGPDHPETRVSIENYKKIPNPRPTSATQLPKLWQFKKPK